MLTKRNKNCAATSPKHLFPSLYPSPFSLHSHLLFPLSTLTISHMCFPSSFYAVLCLTFLLTSIVVTMRVLLARESVTLLFLSRLDSSVRFIPLYEFHTAICKSKQGFRIIEPHLLLWSNTGCYIWHLLESLCKTVSQRIDLYFCLSFKQRCVFMISDHLCRKISWLITPLISEK